MALIALLDDTGEDFWYSSDFRNMIDSHIPIIKTKPGTRIIDIEPLQSYKFEGDLNGLLLSIQLPRKYHYIVGKLNGINHTGDLPGDILHLTIPDFDFIEMLASIYNTKTQSV